MIHTEAPAGAGHPVVQAHDELRQVLAGYDTACRHKPQLHAFGYLQFKRPKFKPLVLSIAPAAAVRRIGSSYECYIGGEQVPRPQCGGRRIDDGV